MEERKEMAQESGEGLRRKHRKLTAQEKWQIYQETSIKGAPVGEVLRRYGTHSSELTKIRRQVEEAALKELGMKRYSKKPQSVPYEEHARLQRELAAKEKALAQMGEEYLILKKRVS